MGASRSQLLPSSDVLPLWLINALTFLSWPERIAVLSLNRSFAAPLRSDKFWRFLSSRLATEHNVYVPQTLPGVDRSWRSLFLELYKNNRNMWDSHPSSSLVPLEEGSARYQSEAQGFKISVFARFRPEDEESKKKRLQQENSEIVEESGKEVRLPLHQRLSMIRMSSGRAMSNREALRVLASEGEWFQKKYQRQLEAAKSSEDEENKTNNSSQFLLETDASSTRLRRGERAIDVIKNPEKLIARVQSLDSGTGRVVMVAPDVGLREFSFDGVLPLSSTQTQVYDMTTKKLVCEFINGTNATVIAYGQTASGKTHTMFGGGVRPDDAKRGVVPRACHEILNAIKDRSDSIDACLGISYVEIYGDHVTDLLQQGARCGHSKVASQRFVLSGAAEHPVHSLADVTKALDAGDATKRRAATAMNDRSSRAHSLLIMTLRQRCLKTGVERESRFFLADLGGSERASKSNVESGAHKAQGEFSAGFQKSERMREAVHINLGLLALKRVIENLNNRSAFVPYTESKLTMLLSEGLGGNSKTSIIICGNMDTSHASETVQTLRFGERCALVENEVERDNASLLASVLADLDAKIASLEATIVVKERWEIIEELRLDANVEENTLEAAVGGKEVKKIATVVGAEEERQELERLLLRRAAFTSSVPIEEVSLGGGSKVLGFGSKSSKTYGLGEAYDAEKDAAQEHERFSERVAEASLSAVVRAKGGKAWTRPEDLAEDASTLEARAKKVNRSKLVYSGISA